MANVQDVIILLQIAISNVLTVVNGLIGRISNEKENPDQANKMGKLQVLVACSYLHNFMGFVDFWSNTLTKLLHLFAKEQGIF